MSARDQPFAGAQNPAGDDPEGQHQHDEDRAGADGHQRLENELRVELDPIQGADTARRRVGEEPAVQQQDPPDEVEPEEHRQRQQEVDGDGRRGDRLAVGVDGPPDEVLGADRRRMYYTDDEFDADLAQRSKLDGDAPVVDAVVDHEQLKHMPSSHTIIIIII